MQFKDIASYVRPGHTVTWIPFCAIHTPADFDVPVYALHARRDDGKTVLYGTAISDEIFEVPVADLAFIREVYGVAATTIQAYFEIVWYDTPTSHYSYEILNNLLLLQLSDGEQQLIQEEINHFTSLYLIKDRDTGLVKIGRSHDPESRLKTLVKQGTLMPRPNNFHILLTWRDRPEREKELHGLYASQRVRGEWFKLDDEDVEEIRRLAGHG